MLWRDGQRHLARDEAAVVCSGSNKVPAHDANSGHDVGTADDVQNVWANFDVSDEVLESIAG
jgi:hypothetical protein